MTEEPITIPEAPKRDFYYSFADEAAAATALQPFYYQPQVQSVDPDTGDKLYDEETGEPVMENDGDPYLVMNSHNHSFPLYHQQRRRPITRPYPGCIIDHAWLVR